VADDQARLRLGQFFRDPGHPVNAGGPCRAPSRSRRG
jgi:hypothetical protein